MESINVLTLKDMFIASANELSNNAKTVDELNVFPVPDGDTGKNMLHTIEGGLNEINKYNGDSAVELFKRFANGTILGARGNSGVILSQIFKGMANGLENSDNITINNLKNALISGVKSAYLAVLKPVEGTILTVFREAVESIENNDFLSVEELFEKHIEQAKTSLVNTKEILPVLKQADVVDSGGAGYVYMLKGMYKVLTGEETSVELNFDNTNVNNLVDYSLFTSDSVMEYGYCTELLIRLQKSKVDINSFNESVITSELSSIGGDSIVVIKTDDIIKLHVHVFEPGKVLNICQKYGEFLTLKIENMSIQHSETKKQKERKKVGVVAVSQGEGLTQIYKEFGADEIVFGGQTMNPSTADFIKAFDNVNADEIIVFPNNSNVILTAKQAGDIYKNSKVYVVETKSMQQGYVALSVLDIEGDISSQIEEICGVLSGVDTIDITYAIRDAKYDNIEVKKGDFIALSQKQILSSSTDKIETAISALKSIENIEEKELITAFFGSDITNEEREKFEEEISINFPDLVFCPYDGGQSVYSILLSIE